EGSEFLLVFDSGDFNEDDTFLVTDWLAHTPKEEIAKDPNVSISDLQSLPSSELYTFPGQVPNTTPDASLPTSPNGLINPGFSLHASQVPYTNLAGGQVKIIDSHSFPVAKTIAMAEVIIQPSAMRELHWHP
ncbi:oxalate decarboxylase, partial [Saitoella complicata NRRL Y-17804]